MIRKLIIFIITILVMTGCQLGIKSQSSSQGGASEMVIEPIQQQPTIPSNPTRTAIPQIMPELNEEIVMASPAPLSAVAIESTDINIENFVEPNCTVLNPHWLHYSVVAGDTLTEIATQFNTNVNTLEIVNCLIDINKIFVGQILRVPPISPTATVQSTLVPTVAVLPALGGVGEPPINGCSVVRNIGINDVFIHNTLGNGGSVPVAKLASYLPLRVEANRAYELILQGYPNNTGWVWKEDTHLVGNGCPDDIVLPTQQPVEPPMNIRVFGNQGIPPSDGCNVVKASNVETAFVYHTPDDFSSRIGRLIDRGWLPFEHLTGTGIVINLPDGSVGWIPLRDIAFVGDNCPIS